MKEDLEMAYTAGLIDGDGSFSLLLHKSVTKENWRSYYEPCIQLSNQYKNMSVFLHKKFGGSLRTKKPQKEHHKILYVWSLRSRNGCKAMIEKIKPYLKLKKEQADLMLEFFNTNHFNQHEGEKYNLKMKNLNRDILLKPEGFNKQTLQNQDNDVFWAYLAGIMDTEGSFTIKKEKPANGGINYKYTPLIQLTMVPAACLNYIRESIAVGNFCVPKAKTAKKGYAYKMNLSGSANCKFFLNSIMPYIREKKKQAQLILNFFENNIIVKHRRSGIPQEILDFREEVYKQMKLLNAE